MNIDPATARRSLRSIENGLRLPEELPDRRDESTSIDEVMCHYLVPGCSLAIIDGGRIVAAQGYGTTERDGQVPITTSTIFQACSISKAVAGVGAMRLVQGGWLALDEDVNAYLGSWQVPANDVWQPMVTLRHLLTHTAGLRYCWFPGYQRGSPTPTALQTVKGEPPANTPAVQVVGIPGTEFRYSGAHYAVLQLLMEDVTGETFPELMQRLIFGPLGMQDSSYDQAFPETRPDGVALGHDAAGVPLTGGWHLQPEYAGAGLWTTAADLCRLALDIQAAWAGESSAMLDREIVREMLTPGPGERGLGWQMQTNGDWIWFGHGGDNVGYKCLLLADAERGRGGAVMTNGDAGWIVSETIFDTIAREYSWPNGIVPGDTAGFRSPQVADSDPDPAVLTAYAGWYQLETGLQLRIEFNGNRLALQADGQPAMDLLPVSESTFLAEAANATITFERRTDGSVSRLRFRQFGDEITGERITRA